MSSVVLPNATWRDFTKAASVVPMPRRRSTPRVAPPFPNRLREVREARGLTLEQVAERINSTAATVSRRESGSRQLKWADLVLMAGALDVTPVDLVGDKTELIPIVGYVGAGAQIFPFDDHAKGQGIDEAPCPARLDPRTTVAVRVRGDSMPPIGDGWLIFYSRAPEPDTAAVIGKLCVVKIAGDGPTLLKRVRRGPTPGRFNLESSNAPLIEDVALDWAAPARAIVDPELGASVAA